MAVFAGRERLVVEETGVDRKMARESRCIMYAAAREGQFYYMLVPGHTCQRRSKHPRASFSDRMAVVVRARPSSGTRSGTHGRATLVATSPLFANDMDNHRWAIRHGTTSVMFRTASKEGRASRCTIPGRRMPTLLDRLAEIGVRFCECIRMETAAGG